MKHKNYELIFVYDDDGLQDSQIISVTILPVNDAPYLFPIENVSISSGETFSYNLQAEDVDGVKTRSSAIISKSDYIFDEIDYESIEKIGVSLPIINLKNAIKQENKRKQEECYTIIKNQHPQLYEFMLKNKNSFNFKMLSYK